MPKSKLDIEMKVQFGSKTQEAVYLPMISAFLVALDNQMTEAHKENDILIRINDGKK